jgi:hypothetical protein
VNELIEQAMKLLQSALSGTDLETKLMAMGGALIAVGLVVRFSGWLAWHGVKLTGRAAWGLTRAGWWTAGNAVRLVMPRQSELAREILQALKTDPLRAEGVWLLGPRLAIRPEQWHSEAGEHCKFKVLVGTTDGGHPRDDAEGLLTAGERRAVQRLALHRMAALRDQEKAVMRSLLASSLRGTLDTGDLPIGKGRLPSRDLRGGLNAGNGMPSPSACCG